MNRIISDCKAEKDNCVGRKVDTAVVDGIIITYSTYVECTELLKCKSATEYAPATIPYGIVAAKLIEPS